MTWNEPRIWVVGEAAPAVDYVNDLERIAHILRRFMREEFWDFNTPNAYPMNHRNRLVLDGKIYDLTDDEVAALERFTGQSLA